MAYQGKVRGKVVYANSGRRLTALLSLLISAFLLFIVVPVGAQNRTLGEIQGTVTDASGARVAGAQVVITNTLTGVSTKVVTNESGVYDANSLVPGTYSVTVTKVGFKSTTQSDVLLRASAIIVNAALEVGAATEQVTVTATPTLLQTESSEERIDISEKLVTGMPIVPPSGGGHTGELGFTALVPGVQPAGVGGGANGLSNNQWVDVNGSQAASQNWTIDGGTRMIGGEGQGLSYAEVPMDAIAQINYLTSNVGAQYGNGFAQFNVTTKSGTNQWHGSAFEFVQNNIFQARNYFSPAGVAVTPYHFNNYGGTIGGPIKKDKAFFFFSYDYIPTNRQSPSYFSLPTQAMHNGDFSGLPVTIYDPNSLTIVNGVPTRTPLPGNKMNPSQMDPVAKAAESYIPLPNYPYPDQSVCNSSGVLPSQCFFNNYYFVGNFINNSRYYNERVDYDVSPRNRLDESAMFIYMTNPQNGNPGAPLNSDINTFTVDNYTGQISDFWTISPSLVNEGRFSMNREDLHASPADMGKGYMAKIGLTGSLSQFYPGLSWSGYSSGSFNSGEFDTHIVENTFAPSDIVTWVIGRHVLKLGGEFDRYQSNYFWNNNESFNFSGIDTRNPADPSSTGEGYADFLFGGVSSWNNFTAPEVGERSWSAQTFVQDDLKVKPNLTLNLGLRYEANSAWTEVQNRIANYNPTLPNPQSVLDSNGNPYAPVGTFGAMCYGKSTPGCPTVPKTLWGLFSPRLGFAWEFKPNWSVRGGYGIYYVQDSQQTYGTNGVGLGWAIQGFKASTDNATPVFQLAQGILPSYYTYPTAEFRQPYSQNGNSVNYTPYNEALTYMQEWRLDIQRAVGSFLLDAAYVGSHGNNLPFERSINQVPENMLFHAASGANMQQYRPNPNFQTINTQLNDGHSMYNSLQLGLRKEFASGMSVIMNYTLSRTTDNGSSAPQGNSAASPIQNDYDLNANEARALSDVPNLFVTGIVYPLPVGEGKTFLNEGGVLNTVLGGWQVSSMIQAHSGLLFTPLVGTANLSGALDGNWFPNRLGSGGTANPNIQRWFDPSAFAVPSVGTFGDSGRNILRAPAMRQVDMSLMKNFRLRFLGEGGTFMLKADAFDLFNHPNFAVPNALIGTAGAGQITGADTSRNLQFGARLAF